MGEFNQYFELRRNQSRIYRQSKLRYLWLATIIQ